jgi:hypothetical protein
MVGRGRLRGAIGREGVDERGEFRAEPRAAAVAEDPASGPAWPSVTRPRTSRGMTPWRR